MQLGLSILIMNCTARLLPKDFLLVLLRQGSNTERVPTMMGLDYLEMAKPSVLPPLWVAMLTGGVNLCEYNILKHVQASTLDLMFTWKFKSPVIITSYGIMATWFRPSSKKIEFLKPFCFEGGRRYVIKNFELVAR